MYPITNSKQTPNDEIKQKTKVSAEVFTPPHIIIALDNLDAASAMLLAKQLNPNQCRLKVGKELFTAHGPPLVEDLMKLNFQIFLDLKFHDIPNTVAKACLAAAKLGVWMLNVHILGGVAMLEAAREAIDKGPVNKPLLVGVTLLTSLTEQDLLTLGFHRKLEEQVLSLAELAYKTGLDGVVCSPHEVALLRKNFGDQFCLVTPGIRFSDSPVDDQKRYLTPKEALSQGADYLVIGRPITQASNPAEVLGAVLSEIK
jgi:orotidine-5'-phosphate decarboxylase